MSRIFSAEIYVSTLPREKGDDVTLPTNLHNFQLEDVSNMEYFGFISFDTVERGGE